MNSDLLRTFIEVAKTRHFGHAAENLYLTQSAVSARIKQLEESLGVVLFTRQRNNILLTPAGERLLPNAENILAAWQMTVQEVGVPLEQSRHLSFGGTTNLWDTFLRSVLPQLAQNFKDVSLRTEMNSSQQLIRGLLGGRLDMCALLDAPINVDLASVKIASLELLLVCNQRHQHITELRELGFVFVDWGTAFNLQLARALSEEVVPVLHTGQSLIALEFILSHSGAAYLPRNLVETHLNEGVLFALEGAAEIKQDVYLIYSKNSEKMEFLAPIIEFVSRSFL